MSLFNKSLSLLFVAGVVLSACTTDILYDEAVEKKLSSTFIKNIPNKQGQFLRSELRDQFGIHGEENLRYDLDIKLSITDRSIGIARDATTTRQEAVANADVILKDRKSGAIIYKDSIKTTNSFVINPNNFYANLSSTEYATQQSLTLLARLIKLKISMAMRRHEN